MLRQWQWFTGRGIFFDFSAFYIAGKLRRIYEEVKVFLKLCNLVQTQTTTCFINQITFLGHTFLAPHSGHYCQFCPGWSYDTTLNKFSAQLSLIGKKNKSFAHHLFSKNNKRSMSLNSPFLKKSPSQMKFYFLNKNLK